MSQRLRLILRFMVVFIFLLVVFVRYLQQSFLSLDGVVSVSFGIKMLKVTHRKDTRTLMVV